MKRVGCMVCLLLGLSMQPIVLRAQNDYFIGAQIIIEPGQTHEQIETWFRLLHENGMNVCRIRMFEEYMRTDSGTWDFSLFDVAFRAAEKYNIKVFATLFPLAKNNSVGGFKFPETDEHLSRIEDYIKHAVSHFKTFRSMYAWVLMNEPGTGGHIPRTEWAQQMFEQWKSRQEAPSYKSNNYTLSVNFDRQKFLLDFNTWYLNRMAQEVKKHDSNREIHVNNHDIFSNVAEYDFPAWRSFLTSLGGSAHPSWHFQYFERRQYAIAMAANCEIIRSGAGFLPFWITELQGGNNTYSGWNAFCPTEDEITQWLWTSICSGAKGIIFWCFNPRSIGEEAGEWAMLDFQNQPTDRVLAAKEVSSALSSDHPLFGQANAYESPVQVVYIRESLWVEQQVQHGTTSDTDYEGRQPGGAMKSALAIYEILNENGIKSNFKEINEFDFDKSDYAGTCIILANQVAIPSRYWSSLEAFVRKGGKLIVEGLTAFYDENMLSLHGVGFPLQDLFGGALSEVICIPGNFEMQFPSVQMPAHLWKSYIHHRTGIPIAQEDGHAIATRNAFGNGTVVWMPFLAGLGAMRTGNKQPLSDFLRTELRSATGHLPFLFTEHQEGVTMQVMKAGDGWITMMINKDIKTKNIELTRHLLKPMVIFPKRSTGISAQRVQIQPEETIVIHWK